MRALAPGFAILLAAACGTDRPGSGTVSLDTMSAAPPAQAAMTVDSALFARGLAVHGARCAECHALVEPPLTAPVFREIALRYAQAFTERAEAIDRLVAYTRSPDLGQSQMEKALIDEWGVMPPQDLPIEELRAVAYFIWELHRDTAVVDTIPSETLSR
jgi:mono/diheme cytochrome c family protein